MEIIRDKMKKIILVKILLISLMVFSQMVSAATSSNATLPNVTSLGNEADPSSLPTRLLFVGNSYMYYNDSLHNHVKRIVSELHPDLSDSIKYKSSTIGGARLKHHNINWLLNHKKIGVRQPFEVVIMQGGSKEVLLYKDQQTYKKTVRAYSKMISKTGAKTFLYMTPAYVAPHALTKPGMIDVISDATVAAAKSANIAVIPVGIAFDEAYRLRPEIKLHKDFDGSHPTLKGTYLAACVVYLSVYGGSLDTLTYNYFGGITPEDARFLRQVATDVSLKFSKEK
ncbi:MAG: hypothetical protein ACI9IA_002107 [Enterobacterales bacterium]|jgi:hypothetical protein